MEKGPSKSSPTALQTWLQVPACITIFPPVLLSSSFIILVVIVQIRETLWLLSLPILLSVLNLFGDKRMLSKVTRRQPNKQASTANQCKWTRQEAAWASPPPPPPFMHHQERKTRIHRQWMNLIWRKTKKKKKKKYVHHRSSGQKNIHFRLW